MNIAKAIFLPFALLIPILAHSADSNLAGNIKNITANASGLLIMLDSGVPNNCVGTPYNWMLIKEANKSMVSVTLSMWASGKVGATVYTNPYSGTGFCEIIQMDPHQM